MELGNAAVLVSRLAKPPAIPESGLHEVLSAWAGQGQLWEALLAVEDRLTERRWTPDDLTRRAHRILFERVKTNLAVWPTRLTPWIDALPAESLRLRRDSATPFPGVSWPETFRRFGWPPRAFHGQSRVRTADSLLVTTLRWTIDKLTEVSANADSTAKGVTDAVGRQLAVAQELVQMEPLASAQGIRPGRTEISALKYEGAPWNGVAPVADEFRAVEESLPELASRLLGPDDEIRWRLFHLAVLGELLLALRLADATIVSRRPLAGHAAGPAYEVIDPAGRRWDLWFEAAGAWSYYERASPYGVAAKGVEGAGRALGPDLLMIRLDEEALILECKYSWNPQVVARSGYEQSLAYATETRTKLAPKVTALTVGPEDVVLAAGFVDTLAGTIGIVPPSELKRSVRRILEASTEGV